MRCISDAAKLCFGVLECLVLGAWCMVLESADDKGGEMTINSFTEIEAWKNARKLVANVYAMCNTQIVKRDYGFRDQIQRAAVSIMSNIAEGFDSGSENSFVQFLNYAYRSASEVESLLYVALDIKYIDETSFNDLMSQAALTKRMIGGFIRYLKSKSNK